MESTEDGNIDKVTNKQSEITYRLICPDLRSLRSAVYTLESGIDWNRQALPAVAARRTLTDYELSKVTSHVRSRRLVKD